MTRVSSRAGFAHVAIISTAIVVAKLVVPASAEGLKVGALLPMTGGLRAYGTSSLNGVKLAIEEVNKAGGVNGGKMSLAVGDTGTSPQQGVDAAQNLVNVEKVKALVGALSSGITIPVASAVSSRAGIPQISSASTSPKITKLKDNDFLFRTVPTEAVQGIALAQVALEKKVKNVSIVYVNNHHGKGLAQSFAMHFKKGGGDIKQSISYEKNQTSYRSELQRAANGKADTMLLIGYPEDGILILKQALKGGFFRNFVFCFRNLYMFFTL